MGSICHWLYPVWANTNYSFGMAPGTRLVKHRSVFSRVILCSNRICATCLSRKRVQMCTLLSKPDKVTHDVWCTSIYNACIQLYLSPLKRLYTYITVQLCMPCAFEWCHRLSNTSLIMLKKVIKWVPICSDKHLAYIAFQAAGASRYCEPSRNTFWPVPCRCTWLRKRILFPQVEVRGSLWTVVAPYCSF